MSDIQFGKIIYGYQQRDAVHVAVTPVEAGEAIDPGKWCYLKDGKAYPHTYWRDGERVGFADPCLSERVKQGETFWLWLKPGSITSLRHNWTHPLLPEQPPTSEQKQAAMKRMGEIGQHIGGFSAEEMVEYYIDVANGRGGCLPNDIDNYDAPDDFWEIGELITGLVVAPAKKKDHYFRCSC